MSLTQKLPVTAIGILSLSLLQVSSAKAATVTYDISGSNVSGFFSFDDSKIVNINPSKFATGLTNFNFQISNQTYTLSDVISLGGPNSSGVYFDGRLNFSTGSYEPILTYVGLTATAVKNGNTLQINPAIDPYYNVSNYTISPQQSVNLINYQQRIVPEPDSTSGVAAGLGIVALGWLKKKKLQIASSSI